MLDTPKGKRMATDEQKEPTMTTPEAVANGVALFAELHPLADKCVEIGAGFGDVFDELCKNKVISTFERDALKDEAFAIFMNFRAQLNVFHAKTTQRAQLKGVDVPQTRDGGPR